MFLMFGLMKIHSQIFPVQKDGCLKCVFPWKESIQIAGSSEECQIMLVPVCKFEGRKPCHRPYIRTRRPFLMLPPFVDNPHIFHTFLYHTSSFFFFFLQNREREEKERNQAALMMAIHEKRLTASKIQNVIAPIVERWQHGKYWKILEGFFLWSWWEGVSGLSLPYLAYNFPTNANWPSDNVAHRPPVAVPTVQTALWRSSPRTSSPHAVGPLPLWQEQRSCPGPPTNSI